MLRRLLFIFIIICIITITLVSCVNQQQATDYDPNKQYAAFLVVDVPQSANVLKTTKDRSTMEGYEIGPVVYYKAGTKEFEPYIKKLLPSKQISLIWIISSLFDTPDIQKAFAAAEAKVLLRYSPVSSAE